MEIKEAIRELEEIKAYTEYQSEEFKKVYKNESEVYRVRIEALDQAINVLEKEIVRTYMDDFFEKFPNARRYDDDTPYDICVNVLYGTDFHCVDDCKECWMKEYKGGEE